MLRRRLTGVSGLLAIVLLLAGCGEGFYKYARDGIAASKGAIGAAQAEYMEKCTADPSLQPCITINKAIDAQNLAVDALNLYCSGPQWDLPGGECDPPSSKETRAHLESRVRAALNAMSGIIAEVEGLIR